jgi:rhodanese-related sulfurtransferase
MKNLKLLLFAGFLSVLVLEHGSDAQINPPKNLTAPEVKNMVEQGNALLIHVLSEIEFEMQHIPRSINIPVIHMETTDKLPTEKDKPLIFYCMGVR